MATNYDERTPLMVDEHIDDMNERVWDRIFEEKCNITLHTEGIIFIQNHVENLVSKVVGRIVECKKYRNFIAALDENTPIAFSDQFIERNLLKVGSFYEGTKNGYPDEFDFIYILAESSFHDKKKTKKLTSELSDLFHGQIKEMIDDENFELGYDFARCSLTGLHGPASKLKLEFSENSMIGNKTISVDICFASRLIFENGLPKDLNVFYDEWKEKVLETGSILVLKVFQTDHPKNETDVKFTITETEQRYVISKGFEKHRKVYRLLKYIFNGSDANENIREIIRRQDNKKTLYTRIFVRKQDGPKVVYDLPSYTIKTLMFHHMHQCHDNSDNKTTDCLYAVLDSLFDVFKVNLDRHTTVWQEYRGIFSVSTKSMLGQPLEIADDYVSAAIIERNLSSLIKTLKNERVDESVAQDDLEDCIPFAEQNIETVTNVVDSRDRKRTWPKAIIALIVIYFVILLGTLSGYPIVIYLANNACDTDTNTTSNQTTGIQYCCIGSKNNTSKKARSDFSCVMYNVISGHRGTDNVTERMSQKRKLSFGNMVISDATQRQWNVPDITNCTENNCYTKISDLGIYCLRSGGDQGMEDFLQIEAKHMELCYSLIPCKTFPSLYLFELKEQISLCRNITDVSLLTSSNNGEDIHVLQTCYENKVDETRSQICCKESDSEPDLPSDDCLYYTNVKNITMTTLRLFHLFLFILPLTILSRRYLRRLINYVKIIRQHTTSDCNTSNI